jgi:NAD(P)-dependent dehydrogenase (short-subunit alcohol dehydrogenase family)
MGHKFSPVQWEDINSEKSYGQMRAYSQSKLANVLHAKELARRLKEENAGISVYVLHPGKVKNSIALIIFFLQSINSPNQT